MTQFFKSIIQTNLPTMAELLNYDMSSQADGSAITLSGYHYAGDKGGDIFVYDTSEPRISHNGGTIIDPTAPFPTDWTNQTQLDAWFNSSNTGTGCWKRQNPTVSVSMFGGNLTGVLSAYETTINKTIVIDSIVTLLKDETVPDNITLEKNRAGIFTGTFTLTINGGMTGDMLSQWFGSSLTADLSSAEVSEVSPKMWGAHLDGSLDDSSAMQKAIISHDVVKVSGGTLTLGSPVTVSTRGKTIVFSTNTKILVSNDIAGFIFDGGSAYDKYVSATEITGGRFIDTAFLGYGILVKNAMEFLTIADIKFDKLQNWGVYFDESTSAYPERCFIKGLTFSGTFGGIKAYSTDTFSHGALLEFSNILFIPRQTGATTPDETYGIWLENVYDNQLSNISGGTTYETLVLKGDTQAIIDNFMATAYGPKPTLALYNNSAGSYGPAAVKGNNLQLHGDSASGSTDGIFIDTLCKHIELNNITSTGYVEAGVYVKGGQDIWLTNADIRGNKGHGLLQEGGTLSITNIDFRDNNADDKINFHDLTVLGASTDCIIQIGKVITNHSQYAVSIPTINRVRLFNTTFNNSGSGGTINYTPWLQYGDLGSKDYFDSPNAITTSQRFYNKTITTFADLDIGPEVSDGNIFKAANTAATSITQFTGVTEYQSITVIFTTANTTLVHNAAVAHPILLKSGANVTPAANTAMSFITDGTFWYEL